MRNRKPPPIRYEVRFATGYEPAAALSWHWRYRAAVNTAKKYRRKMATEKIEQNTAVWVVQTSPSDIPVGEILIDTAKVLWEGHSYDVKVKPS